MRLLFRTGRLVAHFVRGILRHARGTRALLFPPLFVVLVLVLSLGPSSVGRAAPVNVDWETPVHLSPDASAAFQPVLQVAPNATLMAAYNQTVSDGVRNPYYTFSTNNGINWSTPKKIRNSSSNLRQVTLAFDSTSTAHAVWRNNSGLAYAAQPDWPNTANTVLSTTGIILDPHLAIGSDDVLHLVWAQGASGELHNIFHAYSTNDGQDWSAPKALASIAEFSSVPVVVVDANNNAHVVWEERIFDPSEGSFHYEIHYKKGTKSGSNYAWSATPMVVSGSLTSARRPSLLAEGNDLHVAFAWQVNNQEQYPYYARYVSGSGWGQPQDASNDNAVSVNTNSPFYLITTLGECGGNVYVTYHGAEETNAKEQIWGVTSANNWSSINVVTESGLRNVNPSMVCSGSSLHVVYERVVQASENHQIYYSADRNIFRAYLPSLFKP